MTNWSQWSKGKKQWEDKSPIGQFTDDGQVVFQLVDFLTKRSHLLLMRLLDVNGGVGRICRRWDGGVETLQLAFQFANLSAAFLRLANDIDDTAQIDVHWTVGDCSRYKSSGRDAIDAEFHVAHTG